jgi:ABC-type polysaccharide transport system permease subunit
MTDSDKDLTDQALEVLDTKVISPLKKKMFPYLCAVGVFNIVILLLLIYLVVALRRQLPSVQPSS